MADAVADLLRQSDSMSMVTAAALHCYSYNVVAVYSVHCSVGAMMNRVCWVQASLPNSVYYGVHTNPAQHRCRTVCMRQNVAASVVASALVRGAQLSNGVEQPNTGTVLVGHTGLRKTGLYSRRVNHAAVGSIPERCRDDQWVDFGLALCWFARAGDHRHVHIRHGEAMAPALVPRPR